MKYTDLCEILDRKRRQRIAYLRRVAELNAEIKDLYEKKKEMEMQIPRDTLHFVYGRCIRETFFPFGQFKKK